MTGSNDTVSSEGRGAAATPADTDLSLRLWLQLMKCAKSLEVVVATRLRREFDQSLARFDVLSQLYRMPDRCGTVGGIASDVMAASGNITALIDRMAEEGLVIRQPNPADRRSNRVHMTAAGEALFRRMASAHSRWIDAALLDFPEAEKQQLITMLRDVRNRVERSEHVPTVRA